MIPYVALSNCKLLSLKLSEAKDKIKLRLSDLQMFWLILIDASTQRSFSKFFFRTIFCEVTISTLKKFLSFTFLLRVLGVVLCRHDLNNNWSSHLRDFSLSYSLVFVFRSVFLTRYYDESSVFS
jgi:hypothetical protein